MKISNRSYDFDHGAVLSELDCAVCEGPLDWDFQDDFGAAPAWIANCCNREYRLMIKSIRAVVVG